MSISASIVATRERLALLLAGNPGASLYAVIDPVVSDPLAHDLKRTAVFRPVPIRHPDMRDIDRPYLLRLGEPGRDLILDQMLERALKEALRDGDEAKRTRSVCGWMLSAVDMDRVARQLAGRSSIVLRGKRRLLRVWDPRVMDLLASSHSDMQMRDFMPDIQAWVWLGRDGGWRFISAGAADGSISRNPALTTQQAACLEASASINAALDVLQDMGHRVGTPELLRSISMSVQDCIAVWGAEDRLDQVQYALYRELVGKDFDQHSDVNRLMKQARGQGRSAVQALAGLSAEDWRGVKSMMDEEVRSSDIREWRTHG